MAKEPSEFDIQRAFTIWLKGERYRDGTWKVQPAIRPGVVAWHTPNGGERRDAFEGKRLKEIGVEAGIHDYLFLWGGLYGLEFKKPNGKPTETQLSKSQRDMHPRMLAAGMVASAVVDNLPDAKAFAIRHGLVLTNC